MPNYGAQAGSIYNPQQQSEAAEATRGRNSSLFELGEEEKKIDPTYSDAIKTQVEQKNSDLARNDFTYSQALSGQTSGLLGNTNRLTAESYNGKISGLEKEKIEKKAAVNAKRRQVGEQYSSILGGLAAKYAGLKSAWISDKQREDAAIARDDRNRASDRAFAMKQEASSNAFSEKMTRLTAQLNKEANAPDPQKTLAAEFSGYASSNKKSKYYHKDAVSRLTETTIIPNLQAKLGITREAAAKMAYDFRKKSFGE